jgi:hypothetical protein
MGRKKNFTGQSFGQGDIMSQQLVVMKKLFENIRHQKKEDQRIEQLNFF